MTRPDESIGWGIVSTGSIAHTMAGELRLLPDAELTAVSSRSLQRARAFADEFGVERAVSSVDDLLADDNVDVVYVATPHAQHAHIVRAALAVGKPVLCEKSLTTSLVDTEDVVRRARDSGVFLMEAMWTRFMPLVVKIREIVAAGEIGPVRTVTADLGLVAPADPENRLWDPRLGGGALLDLGVYPVAFAQMLLGEPERLAVHGNLNPDGVDAEAGLLLGWADGARALLDVSFCAPSPGSATIVGTTGRLDLPSQFHHPTRLVHTTSAGIVHSYEQEHEGRGYLPMLRAVHENLRAGRTESDIMPLDDTIAVMRILDRALRELGVVYPEPEPVG